MRNFVACLLLAFGVVVIGGCGGSSGTSSNTGTATTGAFIRIDLSARTAQAAASAAAAPSPSELWLQRRGGAYWGIWDITQGQWFAVMGTRPWTTVSGVFPSSGGDAAPAYNISHDDAKAFVEALKPRIGVALDLPTAAEFAALAVTDGYPWTAGDRASARAYTCLNDTWRVTGPVAVGSGTAIDGLYDLVGNVRQWTSDPLPVLVGGSWSDNLAVSRLTASRTTVDPSIRHPTAGFRIVVRP